MVSLYENEVKLIQENLNHDLEGLSKEDHKASYLAHRSAFNNVIDLSKVYCPLLTKIKEEYEGLINHVESAQQFSRIIQEDITTATSFPTTFENYNKHCKDLRQKLSRVREESESKMSKIRVLKMKSDTLKKAIEMEKEEMTSDKKPTVSIRRDLRRLPQMQLDQLTDLETMQNRCRELELQKQELLQTKHTKYVDKQQEQELTKKLTETVNEEYETRKKVTLAIRKKFLIEAALQKVREFEKSKAIHQNIGEVIVRSLVDANGLIKDKNLEEEELDTFFPGPNSATSAAMKESEYIVMCVQKFEKLFGESRFQEAADLAVVVPRGVLRNYVTLLKFKDVNDEVCLYYIQNLMNTHISGDKKIEPDISFVSVDIALKQSRFDLVNTWISKNKITCTQEIADCLVCFADLMRDLANKHVTLELAIRIYKDQLASTNQNAPGYLKLLDSVIECYIKSSNFMEAVDLLKENRSRYELADILHLIGYYPNIRLIEKLIEHEFCSFENVLLQVIESRSNLGTIADFLLYYLDKNDEDMSSLANLLIDLTPGGIDSSLWEELLNFVGEEKEKSILEIASSYMVQLSINRSYDFLCQNGWF